MVKIKDIVVEKNLYDRVLNILGEHKGRVSNKDVDKGLEVALAENFYGNLKTIRGSLKEEDICEDIDIYVNDMSIQVKCRRDSYIYIEDFKVRNFQRIPGWADRSKSSYTLYISPKENNTLHFIEISENELKELLKISRKYQKGEKLDSKEYKILDNYKGPPSYCGKDLKGEKDSIGKYFKFGPF